MANEADIPVPVCETRGDQVGTIVDNIIKISVSQLSLEKQTQDDKHNELPVVEGENFLKSPLGVEVHCEVTPEISKDIEEPDQTVKEGMDTLLLSTKDTSSDHNGTSDPFIEKSEQTKESSLPGEETESHTPCISESDELNVQLKTTDDKSADEKPTEDDTSSNLTNKVASEQEGLKIEGSVEENFNTSSEKASHESIIAPGETVTKEVDEELKEAELFEKEKSTKCALVNEDKHAENRAESLHVGPENIDSIEEQSIDVTLNGNTTKAEEATIDEDNEYKECLESFPPIVSSSHEKGSMDAVLEEGTSDHTDGKTIVEVDKHQEGLEQSSSCGEAHCDVTYVSPDVSTSTENTDQTMKDASDTLLPSLKFLDQPVESTANEEATVEEIQQHAEEVNSTDKDVEPEQHRKDSSVLTSEIDDRDKDDTRVVTQLSNDASSDHHSINESSTENVAISEEKLQKINLPSEQILTNAPRISKGEELNILVETGDNKPVDEEATEEDMACNLTNGVSKEGESDQNEMTSEQDGLQNNHRMDGKIIDEVNEQHEVLENLSSGEAHSEVNNLSPDASKSTEESDSTDKAVVPEQCINDSPDVTSEIDDRGVDEAKVMTQLSKDTSSDDHITDDPTTEYAAVTEEIVQETNLSNEEIESDVACISEAEELNAQVETTDNKYGDEKSTEEVISCDLTNEVSEKEEVGQNKMTSEQEILEKERSAEYNFNTSADEQSTSGETITTLETSNCDELQSKSDLLSKEEETTVEEGDRSVTASEDIEVLSGNTLSHADVEGQSKTLEDEEQKVTEFSERKQSPTCTPVKEDVPIENPAESLHADIENMEVSNSSQENKTEVLPEEETLDAAVSQKEDHESSPPIVSGSLEEGNVNATLQEAAIDHTNETIDEVDKNEEATENPSTTVSTEDAEGILLSKLDHSEDKREDDSVKECEEVALPLPSAREVGDVPAYLPEAQLEDGEQGKDEVCDYERSTESSLLKTESKTENTEDEHANSEHTKASDSVDNISEGGTVDVTEEKEETLENVPPIILNENMEENSCIEVDQKMESVDHLDKENEQLSSTKDCTGNINNDEGNVKDEAQIEDENPSGAELIESIKNTESDEIEETAVDAANSNKKTQEQNVSNEDTDKDLSVEADATEMKHETNLEEEHERPSLTEASKEDLNDDESTILPEPKADLSKVEVPADEESTDSTTPEKESLQLEDHTASTSSADVETTCSLSDKTIDATDKELTHENVSTEIPREHTEENLVAQVDFTESELDEHLEKNNQDLSFTKALESEHIDELNHRGEDSIKPDLENGRNTETTSVKEETEVEKPIDSLQVKPEDIKQQESSADINSSIEEQFPITDQQEISIDNTERESLETAQPSEECVEIKDVAKEIPVCDKEDSIQIEEVGSPNPLNEALEGNAKHDESTKITQDCLIKERESPESLQVAVQDNETPPFSQNIELSSFDDHSPVSPKGIIDDNKEEIADNATGLEGESPEDKDISVPNGDSEDNSPNEVDGLQEPSSEEVSTEKIDNDEPATEHEVKLANEDAVKDNLSENEEKTECASVEEVQSDSLQVPDEDIKDSSSAQDREASHLEEQEPTTDSHGATGDQEDAETLDLTDPKKETLEDENHEPTLHEDTNEDSLKVDGSILEGKEQPEKDSESTPLTDAPKDDIIERTLVTEVTQVENSIDSSQVASEATAVVAPCQDTEISFNVEQILVSEDISSNEVTEKITDATGEETQEAQNLAKSVTHGDDSTNEQYIEAALENEDLSTKLPQVADKDTEEPCLSEVGETNSQEEQILSASPGVLINDNDESKAIEPTVLKKEIPKDEETSLSAEEHPCTKDLNVSKDIIGHSLEASNDNQQDSSITEVFQEHTVTSNEHVSETISMASEVSGKNNDEAVGEASSCGEKTDSEKTGVIDDGSSAVTTRETQGETDPSVCPETEVQVPHEEKEAEVISQEAENDGDGEDNSPNEVDGLQKPSSEEDSTEKIDNDEPTTAHEVKLANEDDVNDNLSENEEKTECASVEEEVQNDSLQVAGEDIKHSSSAQDGEASHLEEQEPTAHSHGAKGDQEDAETLDLHDPKEETLEDKNHEPTPHEDTNEDSLEVDGSILEEKEQPEKDSESTPLTDAPKDEIVVRTLVGEVTQVENSIDSSQVASEATAVVAPCQDTERSFNGEQILVSEDISSNEVTEKITDATGEETEEAQDLAKNVTHEDESPNERNIETALENEDLSTKLQQVAGKDTEESCLSEVRETSSQEEQILSASTGVPINDNEENKAIEPTVLQKVILKDEETSLTAEEHPCAEDLNVSRDIIGHSLEASNDNHQESSITEVFKEHIVTSNQHVSESTSMESEVSGGEKTDSEKTGMIDDGSTAVTTSETQGETYPSVCLETEVQVPHEEKEAEVIKQETENDENIKETLPNDASEGVTESKEVDAEEETDSNNYKELTSSPISVPSEEVLTSNVALEEHSTSNSSQEPERETREGAETEQDQNQEPALQVSEPIQDLPEERIERDTHSSLARANDYAITEEVEENIIETTERRESGEGNGVQKGACEEKTSDSMVIDEEMSPVTYLETKNAEEGPDIEETVPIPSSAEETSNYGGSLAKEKSDSNEAATMAIENKSGDDSINQDLEAIAHGCELISKTEEGKLEADAEIQEDEAGKEEIQEEITRENEIVKGDSLSTKEEQSPRVENISAEIDEKATEEKILASEAIENILHQEDRVTSNEEPTIHIDSEKANELDIACVQTDTQAKEGGVQITVIPGRESEEQNKKDEISGSDEVQARDEEVLISEDKTEEEANEMHKEAYVEAEKLDFASQAKEISERAISDEPQDIPDYNENSGTFNKFSEEDYPNKNTECEVPSAEVAVTGKTIEETIVAAEVQEEKVGIALEDVVPEAAGFENNEVPEEVNDKCAEMADTSATVENPTVSMSKIIPELTEGIPPAVEYQETKLHSLPEELNTKDSEVKRAEIDSAMNVQSTKDIGEECKESSEASSNEKPVEGDPEQKMETIDVQETEPIQNAPVSETVKQETEERQLARGIDDVHEEEKNTYNIIPKQLESSYGAESEKVSEPIIHHTSIEDTSQQNIKTSEKDIQVNIGGLHSDDASEQNDKHVVLETDDAKNSNPENLDGDCSKTSSEISRGEHETVQPPKLERETEQCRNEDGTNHEVKAKPESEETSPTADHSPAGKAPTGHVEDLQAEKTDEAEHENSKTDEERENEEESSHEPEKSDLSSEAPVMVDMRDADVKVTPKKSHNILSGVGSKVKHSIAKVKKAITGKSSHPKTPSPSKVVS